MKVSIDELHALETEMLKEVAEICDKHSIDYYMAYGGVIGAVRHRGPIPWDPDVDILIPNHQFHQFIEVMRKELPDKFYVDYHDINPKYPALFPRVGLKGYSSKRLHIDVFRLVGAPKEKELQETHRKRARFLRTVFLYKNTYTSYFGKIPWKRRLYRTAMKIIYLPVSNRWIIRQFEKISNKYPYEDAETVFNVNGGYGNKELLPKSYYGEGVLLAYDGLEIKVPAQYEAYLTHFYGDYMQLPPENQRKIIPTFEIIEQEI